MSDWCPSAELSTSMVRARMLQSCRTFFSERDVLEISTPILSRAAVSDPQIESIAANLDIESHANFYLRTSPEFCMKRLLSAGYPDIYEICKVFRDGEAGRRHQPEFTMVEWYRLNFGLDEIIDDTVTFIHKLLPEDRLAHSPDRISYQEAFLQFTNIDPLNADIDALITACNADHELTESLGRNRNDWLNFILTHAIAPEFASDRLTVLYHYPASQAALAQLCPHDETVADRFEIFLADMELANGYVELTDADEQRRRCHADQLERRSKGMLNRPLDAEFLAALDKGLPHCAGVAVGFDRLMMIHADLDDIRDVLTFAYRREP